MPQEESLLVPLNDIDVIRSIYTDLDVAQEKRIDDQFGMSPETNLSDSWTGFTRFTLLKETSPKIKSGPEGDLTKIQTTSRPDHRYGLTLGQELEKCRAED